MQPVPPTKGPQQKDPGPRGLAEGDVRRALGTKIRSAHCRTPRWKHPSCPKERRPGSGSAQGRAWRGVLGLAYGPTGPWGPGSPGTGGARLLDRPPAWTDRLPLRPAADPVGFIAGQCQEMRVSWQPQPVGPSAVKALGPRGEPRMDAPARFSPGALGTHTARPAP